MDYKELSRVADSATNHSKEEKRKKIQDAIERRRAAREKARKVADSKAEEENKVADSKEYGKFKVTDSYKELKKKIKDDLMETETTEDAVAAVINALEGQPAEQVLAATVEALAEAIDVLQGSEELAEEEIIEEELDEKPAEE